MKTIAYFPEADEELKNALNASRDPTRLRQAVQDALQDIASGRVAHAPVGRSPCRQCGMTPPYPYSIVYTETATEVVVVAFAHTSRKPGYWKNRLP